MHLILIVNYVDLFLWGWKAIIKRLQCVCIIPVKLMCPFQIAECDKITTSALLKDAIVGIALEQFVKVAFMQ